MPDPKNLTVGSHFGRACKEAIEAYDREVILENEKYRLAELAYRRQALDEISYEPEPDLKD
jgi:hypothetical protein